MALPKVTLRQLFENGVHFGHRTRYWNPKMAPYIFGVRQKLHIIDLEKTEQLFNEALVAIEKTVASRGKVLFVGTKHLASSCVREEAKRCGMPYVNVRWLGGMLTNYKTIRKSIKRLCSLEDKLSSGYLDKISKKEGLSLLREKEKLERSFAGIKDMGGLPDLLFIIDVGIEKIALQEAVNLGIPVVGIVDTNNSPDHVAHVIPGNDDSMRAISFYTKTVADVIIGANKNSVLTANSQEKEADESALKTKRVITTRKKVVSKKAAPAASSKSTLDSSSGSESQATTAKSTQEVASTKSKESPKEEASVSEERVEAPKKEAPADETSSAKDKETE